MFYFASAILIYFWGVETLFTSSKSGHFTALLCLVADSTALFFTMIQSAIEPHIQHESLYHTDFKFADKGVNTAFQPEIHHHKLTFDVYLSIFKRHFLSYLHLF